MDWHKELERTLSSAGESSLYDGHVSSSQHFGSALPSLLQRQPTERSPWGYRPPHQWPPQMWMAAPQHRAPPQVWGDPTFRPFFSDPSQELQHGSQNIPVPSFRSPWMSEPAHDVKTIENVLNSVAEHPVNYRTNQIPDIQAFRQQAESLVNAYHQSKSPAPTPPQPSSFPKSERQLDSARSEERCNVSPENLADRLNSTTHPPPGHFSGETQRNEARYKSPTSTSHSHVQSSQPNLSADVQERFRISPGPGNNSRHQYPDASHLPDKYRSSPVNDYTTPKSDERYRNSGITSPHFPSNSSFSDIPSHVESEGRYGPSPDIPTNLATRDENDSRTKMDYANDPLPRKFSPSDTHQTEETLLKEDMKPRNLTLEKRGPSPDLPKDFTCDRLKNCEDMDTSEQQTFEDYEQQSEGQEHPIENRISREPFKNEEGEECEYNPPTEQFKSETEPGNYDIIKNMTEKYGGAGINSSKGNIVAGKDTADSFETRRSNLENVLSKMSKVDEENHEENVCNEEQINSNGIHTAEIESEQQLQQPQSTSECTENEDPKDFKPKIDHKPIKLKIARGEVVANTVLDSVDPDEEVQPKEESGNAQNFVKNEMISSWALAKTSILALHEKIQTDPSLKERVSDIVGDDVLSIFASAVDEAENAPENNIENKNVVFLYYAVKNSTNLDTDNFNKNELEPLSNLALSIPLLSNLCKFVLKDQNMKEELHSKIGKEDFEYLEMVTNNSVEEGDEFLQDESITPKIVKLYHATRNIVLFQAFTKLDALYKKIENILTSTETTDDIIYNVSIVRLKTLISAPWNQQVIAAEAMKYDFDFLGHVYSFWKKVITQRPSKPVKVKKITKTKPPTAFDNFGRPKRSRRRRNDVVTYDEDVMQNCVIKSETNIKLEPEDEESVPEGTEELATNAPCSTPPSSPSPSTPSQDYTDLRMQDMDTKPDQFRLRPLICKKRKGACNHVIVDGRDHYDRKTWAALAKLEVDV